MTLGVFAQEYDALPPGEQTLFAETVRWLLAESLIWRELDGDRRIYSFLSRRTTLVAQYLSVAGWELRHDDHASVYHVVHVDGAHRRRLGRETSIWLLLVRMLYAEGRESPALALTRYPVVSVGEIARRYAEFFPGQALRKKASLEEALRTMTRLKLIRAAGEGLFRTGSDDQLVELLPTLEVVIPADAIETLMQVFRQVDEQSDEGTEAATESGEE